MDIDALTERELIDLMQADTPFARAAKVFRSAVGNLEQMEMQRRKPTIFERRRTEFKAVQRILAEVQP